MFPDHLLLIVILCALMAAGSGGVLIWAGGPAAGPRWAELGIGVGFLSGFVAVAEGLPLIDNVANPALGNAALGATAAVAALTTAKAGGRLAIWAAAIVAICAGAWSFAGPGFVVVQTGDLIELLGLGVAAFVLPFRLQAAASAGIPAVTILVMLGLSLAALCFVGHAAVLTGLDLAYVAALSGAALWVRPIWSGRLGFAATALGGSLVIGLAAAFLRNAVAPSWVLIPVAACACPDWLVARLPLSKRLRRNKSLRSFLLKAALLCPAAIGVGLALLTVGR